MGDRERIETEGKPPEKVVLKRMEGRAESLKPAFVI
jgi:hypothetical protein